MIYYLLRSRLDGNYLVAHLQPSDSGYLLLFREDFEALSYVNAHAGEVAHKFAVESIPNSQLSPLMKRWGFHGVGIVQDPLVPRVEFLAQPS
ncbi:hypothetical protein H6G20_09120 [Desertifilum sp. FACHB-1129]|uniref:Uncharacterized protein n=2 Tax=Desertifilum tharense IPPAS B-1220 TaxID=1781255 RepID=A0A1E5QQ54_9CYAN|nr:MULTISPECIES: hypothetical protein [Desertifilum]MDA0209163.1 hypothetical protein [Cyanobacteria bacterium FC1]MBD2311817.1 hypothetical protein [Desertifilum sp. FACHB-1129]MBD2322961.1 hypothetical protein [Desertifilum sp. FACHB-866]MBD2333392.1 hypothetical protein [Desertifilum sp. FACHB-868]OEJ76805.1 hypothetical protein BH720_02170 [Desertifilum tharense IPPAS B-1220]